MILQRRRGEIYAGPGALNDADGIGSAFRLSPAR